MTTLDIGDTVKFTRAIPATALNPHASTDITIRFRFVEVADGAVGTITDVNLNAHTGRMVYTVELLDDRVIVNVNSEHLERLENV